MKSTASLLTLALLAAPSIAAAQTAPPPAQPAPAPTPTPSDDGAGGDEGPDIVVQGQRQPGSVIGDIPPERQLGPADIRSYGVGSLTELLTELGPQIRSDRGSGGAPVVLLDGKRISGFGEIRDLPTEAIQRIDILPEEVALKYGYRADQKVVNVVLRRRFRAATVELADRVPTAGGRNAPDIELDLLKIARAGRINLHLEYEDASALTEDERNIAQPTVTPVPGTTVVGVSDPGAYRTLLPATQNFSANAVYARSIGAASATLNGTLTTTRSESLLGLPSVALTLPAGNPFSTSAGDVAIQRTLGGDFSPLRQENSTVAAHLGSTINGVIGKWQWTLTGNYDRSDSETFTDTGLDTAAYQARLRANDPAANPLGTLGAAQFGILPSNRGYSTSSDAGVDALLSGTLFALPAGEVSTTIRVGADTNDFNSRSYRAGLTQTGKVSRDTVNGQVNIDVPLTSRSKDVLAAIGSLSANFNYALDHLSDFGTLRTLGYGLNWSPVVPLRLIASVTDQGDAPSQQQLGNPQIITTGVRVFDYVLGQNATVTTVSGGNPALLRDTRHTVKLGATLKPWSDKDFSLSANYVEARVENPIVSFPSASAAIEGAFPTRFTRDSTGTLQRIDTRPINFAETSRSELRWGVNFSTALKSKLQKQIEAWRAGKGPNPFAGLPIPASVQRQIDQARAQRGGAAGGGAPGGGDRGGPGGGGPGGGGRGGFGGFGGFGGGGGGRGGGGAAQAGGRLNFALYHTWHFTDRVLVQQGGPSLDLLRGDAIGSSGGQPRHELEAQAGYNNNGIGVRLSGNWQSATRVNGGTVGNPETLRFSGLGTANLRLFADLGQQLDLLKKHPWLRATRVALSVENVLDSRQRVTDASGVTPISYQPGYLNPLGRTVRLTVRKLFF